MTSVVPDFIKDSVIGKAMGLGSPATAAQLAEDLAGVQGKLAEAERIKGRAEKGLAAGGNKLTTARHQSRLDIQNEIIANLQKEIQDTSSDNIEKETAPEIKKPKNYRKI